MGTAEQNDLVSAMSLQIEQDLQKDQDNAKALDLLLQEMAEVSESEYDKGARFETLVQLWLMHEPTYDGVYSNVQTYKDWALNNQDAKAHNFSSKDIGVDLVATRKIDGKYIAIQCKFYQRDHQVNKVDINSFISASSSPLFAERILVTTSESCSDNFETTKNNLEKPFILITRTELEQSQVDWNRYRSEGKVVLQDKKDLRPHQKQALEQVIKGLQTHDRGKLIMACGTGKTFTALKIAEAQLKNRGLVVFFVPSLALLAQTLTEWKQQSKKPITAFAVCSDSSIGKKARLTNDDYALTQVNDLSYPATTESQSLANQVDIALENAKLNDQMGMTVVFSTYQSIATIHEAQEKYGLPAFDLIICDEAHRTSGGHMATEEDSLFTKVHDNSYINGSKRIYMTATPKVYGTEAKKQQADKDVVLYSMDDESIFGPTFFTFSFSQAVMAGCLVDFKVIVLATEEGVFSDEHIEQISQKNIARMLATWKALCKFGVEEEEADIPIKRAVAFAQRIAPSKTNQDLVSSKFYASEFEKCIHLYKSWVELSYHSGKLDNETELDFVSKHDVDLSCEHIDGSMNAFDKTKLLNWLKKEPKDNECKVLFNVRCLSEGVDVPSLDAIVFLSKRKSQVDVVQSVGRVMRIAPGKKRGYVIIPLVVANSKDPEQVLSHSDEFSTIWQVLNALRSINPDLVLVDGALGKLDSHIEVIASTDLTIKGSKISAQGVKSSNPLLKSHKGVEQEVNGKQSRLNIQDEEFLLEEKIKATIINRVGNRKEWSDWAEDVSAICTQQVENIKALIYNSQDKQAQQVFESYKTELQANLSENIDENEAIDMLAQHIVIKPVLDALFSEYPFTEHNPVSHALSAILEKLDAKGLVKANQDLQAFYSSVKLRMLNVKTVAERQTVIVELFDNFFKKAFPKLQEKLGIVYTPIEVVDFINTSVNDILHRDFGVGLADPNVHILDPFTGTGTFITRLMQNHELIPENKLPYKYENELHAFELVPLAYYVASMNIESVYHEICPQAVFKANNIVTLTDTFALSSKDKGTYADDSNPLLKLIEITSLSENARRRQEVNSLPIKVIVGNPPYSVGQENANDNNQNDSHPNLEKRLVETYVKYAKKSKLKSSLYDSYIKAFRWASDQVEQGGIVAFVTNAGWIASDSGAGVRKSFVDEFDDIYIYHLKGNQRTVGEESRKQGGKIFGGGSRSPIAITILVKKPNSSTKDKQPAKIHFACVDDYLSREQKLVELLKTKSILNAKFTELNPDEHDDWLNQRRNDYYKFIRLDGKKTSESKFIFKNFSSGIVSSRDYWVFNSSKEELSNNMQICIDYYNNLVDQQSEQGGAFESKKHIDLTKLSWSDSFDRKLANLQKSTFDKSFISKAIYRPFYPQLLYRDHFWIERNGQHGYFFPYPDAQNLLITTTGIGINGNFSCHISNKILAYGYLSNNQCFPRYIYKKVDSEDKDKSGQLGLNVDESNHDAKEVINGYIREDAITETALEHFREAYPENAHDIDADAVFFYIYGILNSKDYQSIYANNLTKALPRIPRVATYGEFVSFRDAGKALADLQANFESQPTYKKCEIVGLDKDVSLYVKKLKYGKLAGQKGKDALDKTTIIYNNDIVIKNIPLEVQRFVINNKSALDWVVERCGVSVDSKTGIVNDFNEYAKDQKDKKYILNLILRVIYISLKTLEIVDKLPKLHIHHLDL